MDDNRDLEVSAYNYAVFRGDAEDFDAFMGTPHVGERSPDAALTDLASGQSVRLADLWRANHLILEFGSFT